MRTFYRCKRKYSLVENKEDAHLLFSSSNAIVLALERRQSKVYDVRPLSKINYFVVVVAVI